MHTYSYFKTQYNEHLLITSDPTETVNTHDKYYDKKHVRYYKEIFIYMKK
jgi:hypothetical protein